MAVAQILGTSTSQQNTKTFKFFGFPLDYGQMASSMNRKKLVCFYCNKKSDLRYDGQMKKWTCSTCEAVNYLDEDGNITDPPVATEYPATYDLKFTATRPEYRETQTSDSNPFCETCIKNQHLYNASLQQYHVETDPFHPQYRESERLYYKYKKTLEKTYPQVCEDCEPRVLERMRVAGKVAKTDHLRRLVEKTRARSAAATNTYSCSDIIFFLGKLLWYMGFAGQLLWSGTTLLAIYGVEQPNSPRIPYLGTPAELAQALIATTTSTTWARSTFLCSLASMWWNPMFKQLNNGFMNHITGFGDWYKLQLLHIILRLLFFYITGTGTFSDLYSPASAAAHVMAIVFLSILAFQSKRALKVDMTPLWNSRPEKLPFVGPRSGSSSPESMGGILDKIAANPSNGLRQPSPPPASEFDLWFSRTGAPHYQKSHTRPPASNGIIPSNNSISLLRDKSYDNGRSIATRETSSYFQQQYVHNDVEEMEWIPSIPQTQTRAFNPVPRPQNKSSPFSETNTSDRPSVFYGRLPEAPISPAHRLRNPPNQPRLRVSPREVKENFFKNVTRRGADSDHTESNQKHDMNLAQQRFFPPTPPSEAGNTLADLLTSFSLSSPETDIPVVVEDRSEKVQHLWQALALFFGLFFWNHSVSNGADYSKSVMLTVIIGGIGIGVRTILDNTVFARPDKQDAGWHSLCACIGGIELAAAGYGLVEVLTGRSNVDNFSSFGTLLIGGVLMQEIWLALFGR